MMKRFAMGTIAALVAALVGLPGVAVTSAAAASKPCTGPSKSAEWASFGRDLTNSRDQEATDIDASNVSSLKPAWALASSEDNGSGAFESTPVVGGGCLFAATTSGSIFAADPKTGKVLWQTNEYGGGGLAGGIFAPAYSDGVVYAIVGRPVIISVVALDASTGAEIWNTPLYQDLVENAELHALAANSSVVVYDGMVFAGLAGTDSFEFSHPSFFILDAKDGSVIKKTTVIPQDKWLDGYAGGGIWGTAVVDTATKYLYVGTANPYNKRREHKHTNAIIKVDMDRHRKTFGDIVGSYRGDIDYDPMLYDTPQCKYLGEAQLIWFSVFCGQKDIDFGASPSLFTNSRGDTIVADLQKSCTVHAVHAGSMTRLWRHADLGAGGASGCAGGMAYDDHALYVNINDGFMYALNKDTGATLWKTAYRDAGPHYQPVTVANGVVYTPGNNGHLYALDAKTGKILVDVPIKSGGQSCSGTQSAGISVVGNTVYVSCDVVDGSGVSASIVAVGGGAVFAYRLPG
jgi:outer membrane protein assembly factor BamB